MSKRTLWFKKNSEAEPVQVELHEIDASHALSVDPERWFLERPADSAEPEPEPEPEPYEPTE